MKLHVNVDGQPHELEIERDGDSWRFDGSSASVLEVEPGIYSVLLGTHSYEARLEQRPEGLAVSLGGDRYMVQVVDPRKPKGRAAGLEQRGRQKVLAPMPGKVVRVLVEAGQTVAQGQGLIVMEAMKMQNELKAPKNGQIVRLSAKEGVAVGAGEVLAEIE